MRILPERCHLDRESFPRREPEGNGGTNPGGFVDSALPMFRTRSNASSHPTVCQGVGRMRKHSAGGVEPTSWTPDAGVALDRLVVAPPGGFFGGGGFPLPLFPLPP